MHTCNNLGESQNNYATKKKPGKRENILYDYICIKFWKNKLIIVTENRALVAQGLVRWEANRVRKEELQGGMSKLWY